VQVKSGLTKLASAGPQQAVAAEPAPLPQTARNEPARAEMPPQPAGFGTGNGILGVLPSSSLPPAPSQAMAYAAPAPQAPQIQAQPILQQQASLQDNSSKPQVTRSGWIIQVGALESAAEAQQRIEAARSHAQGLLSKADPFTETVSKGDKTLVRARFAVLDREQAEAVCKKLKRADISCMTMHN
jgi:D-alanyl-D-alanine carboxypeptidase